MKFLLTTLLTVSLFASAPDEIKTAMADAKLVTRLSLDHQTEDVIQLVKPYLPMNPTIIEAGASDGLDVIYMSKIWPRSTIHTFEPVPELFSRLEQNMKPLANVKTYQLALADKSGIAPFYLSSFAADPSQSTSGSSSLFQPKEHLIYAPYVAFKKKIDVKTVSLDEWASNNGVQKIDFLWLDMQGSELHMLKASELAKDVTAIMIEVEFVEAYKGQYLWTDIKKWMQERDFQLIATDFTAYENSNPWGGNALFIKKSALNRR